MLQAELIDVHGTDGYVQYYKGSASSRVVLSAPHGGNLKPHAVKTRHEAGCQQNGTCLYTQNCGAISELKCTVITRADVNTDKLAQKMWELFPANNKPHLIINLLHRSKLDANRDLPEATFGDPVSTIAWNEYHAFINQAKTVATASKTRTALFIDLHGQGSKDWNMVGMLLDGKTLESVNPLPNSLAHDSSVEVLVPAESLENLVRGPNSIGGLMEKKSSKYSMVPSPTQPHPGGDRYYRGGYNTRRHTDAAEMMCGFQMEVWEDYRYDTVKRDQFAADFVEVIQEWIRLYF